MGHYLLTRISQIPITLGIILGISFFLIHAAPGDPVAALAGDYVTKEYRDLIIQHYGLDQPLITQSFKYFKNVVTGDFETPTTLRHQFFCRHKHTSSSYSPTYSTISRAFNIFWDCVGHANS